MVARRTEQRWRTVRMRSEDVAVLASEAKRTGHPLWLVLRMVIERAQLATHPEETLRGIEQVLERSIDRSRPLVIEPFHTRITTTDGARFEDFDRFHLIAAVAYLRELARELTPKRASGVEDRVDAELDRLYGDAGNAAEVKGSTDAG